MRKALQLPVCVVFTLIFPTVIGQMQTVCSRRLNASQLKTLKHLPYIPCCSSLRRVSATPQRSIPMQAGAAVDCSPLWAKVLEVYSKAQESGAATKTDTKTHICEDGGIAFVLRIASALKSKPKGLSGSTAGAAQQQQQQPAKAFKNPFLPYEEDLWVQHLSDTHTLLLNKFNVVPHHVLVVTRQFESQQDPLNARDLAATQQGLASMPYGGCAFYNCGEHSGRSQPHKHLQIVPLPFSGNDQQEQEQQQVAGVASSPVDHVVSAAQAAAGASVMQPFALKQLPYRAYAVVLDQGASAEQFAMAADQLLQLCQAGLPAPLSYNVVITNKLMLMAPRRQEMCGNIAINSLGFAGTILLRSEEDLAYALQRGPLTMLAEVGQPWDTEQQQDGMHSAL